MDVAGDFVLGAILNLLEGKSPQLNLLIKPPDEIATFKKKLLGLYVPGHKAHRRNLENDLRPNGFMLSVIFERGKLKPPNDRRHPRPFTRFMKGALKGRRVQAVVRSRLAHSTRGNVIVNLLVAAGMRSINDLDRITYRQHPFN